MSRRLKIASIATLAVALVCVFAWGLWPLPERVPTARAKASNAGRADELPAPAARSPSSGSVLARTRVNFAARTTEVPHVAPLPPAFVRFADIYEDLKARVAMGDARAACRIGVEMERCALLEATRASLANKRMDLAREEPGSRLYESTRRMIASMEPRVAQGELSCSGFPTVDGSLAFEHTLVAALAGNRHARWRLTSAPGIWLHDRKAPDGPWVLWRENIAAVVMAGIEDGDPRVFRIASRMHHLPTFDTRVFPQDHTRALAFMLALAPAASDRYRATIERDIAFFIKEWKLTQEQIAQAGQIAETLPALKVPATGFDWTGGMMPNETGKECEEN